MGAVTIGTGYGLWEASRNSYLSNATTLNCFQIYFENQGLITMTNIKSMVNSEGEETPPYTITITNICNDAKEMQLRLNIQKETTADIGALTIKAAGNIEKNTILYKNLDNTKTSDKNTAASKLVGKVRLEPKETIRTNVKLWFDERKAPNMDSNSILRARFEIIDTESSIKATLTETILQEAEFIDSKDAPNFELASYGEEGLYSINMPEGKYYYYRGVVNNNYVRFANRVWRIVGINPDNSVKLILDSSVVETNYSNRSNSMDYTGYKYVYNQENVNNEIENYLENWYRENIYERGFDGYVVEEDFCNDSSNRRVNYVTIFGAYDRLVNGKMPEATCPSTTADFGGIYNQKIGLITADEVALAGGLYGMNNYNYYLYNGDTFYTASPAEYVNNAANVFVVTNTGAIAIERTDSNLAVRPVINLISTVTYQGAGTVDNPYIIDID